MALRHRFGGLDAIWSCFLSVQKATLGTGSRRPGPGPSLSGIVFQCGEANVLTLEGCKLELVSCRFNILSFQKATLGTGSRRPGPLTPRTRGRVAQGSAARDVLLLSGRRPRSPCPCRRPSVATESYLSAYARQPARGPC